LRRVKPHHTTNFGNALGSSLCLRLRDFAIMLNVAQTTWLNLKDIAIDEADDGLDPNWLLLPYETRLQKKFEAVFGSRKPSTTNPYPKK
jgi:hypothetical protein